MIYFVPPLISKFRRFLRCEDPHMIPRDMGIPIHHLLYDGLITCDKCHEAYLRIKALQDDYLGN